MWLLTLHERQAQRLDAHKRVHLKQLVELAHLEQEHRVKVRGLELPPLRLPVAHLVRLDPVLGNKQGGGVVGGVGREAFLGVADLVGRQERELGGAVAREEARSVAAKRTSKVACNAMC